MILQLLEKEGPMADDRIHQTLFGTGCWDQYPATFSLLIELKPAVSCQNNGYNHFIWKIAK